MATKPQYYVADPEEIEDKDPKKLQVKFKSKWCCLPNRDQKVVLEGEKTKHVQNTKEIRRQTKLERNQAQISANRHHYIADPKEIEEVEDSEKREVKIKPRGLNIVHGNDSEYWFLPNPDQKDMAAELLNVCWLEVTGSVALNHQKKYQIGFKVTLKSYAFGWENRPVHIMTKWGKKGKYSWERVDLVDLNKEEELCIPENFIIDVPDDQLLLPDDQRLYFGLYEYWHPYWKGGLQIHYAFVREAN